jgi:hypothetical protein
MTGFRRQDGRYFAGTAHSPLTVPAGWREVGRDGVLFFTTRPGHLRTITMPGHRVGAPGPPAGIGRGLAFYGNRTATDRRFQTQS